MMQGFHPFRPNDTVFQKTVALNDFYLRGPDGYPLGQIQSQGRTHGVMAQTVAPWIPGVGVRRVGRARCRLARRCPRTCRERRTASPSTLTAASACTTSRTTWRRTTRLVKEMKRILRRLGFWVVVAHSHRDRNTTHQCGTLCFGTDPRTSVLDPVLPHARCREPVRRRRVVLPVIGSGQSGADDRRAGASCCRSYQANPSGSGVRSVRL